MKIGIDISQLAYQDTGVANYLQELLRALLSTNKRDTFILFFSSMRRVLPASIMEILQKYQSERVVLKIFRLPPSILHILWNKLHMVPIENFIGNVDVFITSDWTEPPARLARKVTILYDLIVYTYPEETDKKIISIQKSKLYWVKKESTHVFCISEATRIDAENILKIERSRTSVLYPGINL